jgi:hypothetical protein|tara:strand:+ start:848 stop:1549 length:702 start_codon:yes stop_codon:yes gene_type:complete
MNVGTIQIKFRQRLNKLASNDYDNIECWQIVEAYNKAQLEWCRRQLHGNNMYKEGDEMSKRRIDDLQLLLTTQTLLGNMFTDFFQSTNWPTNYLEYKRVSTDATDECCKDPRSMTVYLAEESNIDLYMRDPLKRPDFQWGETYCTLTQDTIKIFKKDFNIINPTLVYYRKPVNIEIIGCVDPYTEAVSVVDVNPEFKDDIVEVIIDEAVAIVAGDIDAVNQAIRGSQSAEKNN